MDERVLERQFERIGARLVVDSHQWTVGGENIDRGRHGRRTPRSAFELDIRDDRLGEYFWLSVGAGARERLEFVPLNIRPDLRHLVLLASGPDVRTNTNMSRFLCGHDERHWFAALLPEDGGRVTTVTQAFEVLKPTNVVESQTRNDVRRADRNRRHNAGFIRQGEWFFVPVPEFRPDDVQRVLHNEPMRAGTRTPHIAEMVYRRGGVTVYVTARYPSGLEEKAYRQLQERNPQSRRWYWQVMRRDAQVFALGKVRHPDHKTIELPFWHEVFLSAEAVAAPETARATGLVFLD